jgi:hypothetical protein
MRLRQELGLLYMVLQETWTARHVAQMIRD